MHSVAKLGLCHGVRPALAPVLRASELYLLERYRNRTAQPVFIVGVPRSGTTLLSQTMLHSFRMAYFSNFAASYPYAPVAATRLIRREIQRAPMDFESQYGKTRGRVGPNEAGKIWRRWLVPQIPQDGSALEASVLSEARATVAGIEAILDGPFLNKAIDNSVRIRALNVMFPQSLFIRMRRCLLDNAISLLVARCQEVGSESDWWSVKPPEFSLIRQKHYLDQVCEQMYYIDKAIDADVEAIGPNRCAEVDYQDLCQEPERVLEHIGSFLTSSAVKVTWTNRPVPEFRPSKGHQTPPYEVDLLEEKLVRLYGK